MNITDIALIKCLGRYFQDSIIINSIKIKFFDYLHLVKCLILLYLYRLMPFIIYSHWAIGANNSQAIDVLYYDLWYMYDTYNVLMSLKSDTNIL